MELTLLRKKICDVYGSVYKFAPIVGYTQSMVNHMLHGRRKIFPYAQDRMADLLGIPKDEYITYFGEENYGLE